MTYDDDCSVPLKARAPGPCSARPGGGTSFELPGGYRDRCGRLHRDGVMRTSTARDEMRALSDFRVHLRPEAYLSVVLSRTVVRLGDLETVHVGVVEEMSAADRAHLEQVYRRLNGYSSQEER